MLVVGHPVVAHLMASLRDASTDNGAFRTIVAELSALIAYEALRDLTTSPVSIDTPVAAGVECARVDEMVLLVPVLRAGLGMIPAIQGVVPLTEVAHVGLRRDEATLEPEVYLDRLPRDLAGRRVVVCDPMLATGGSLVAVCDLVVARGAGARPGALPDRVGAGAGPLPLGTPRHRGRLRRRRPRAERPGLHRAGARRRRRPALRAARVSLPGWGRAAALRPPEAPVSARCPRSTARGASAMKSPSSSMHSGSSSWTTSTPSSPRESWPPTKLRDSPMTTAPIWNWRTSPEQYQHGDKVVTITQSG